MTVDIRRGTERFADRATGRLTRHGFAFGEHYDPDRLDFGPMVCHDDHLLGSGQGFDEHPHSGLEIVSWVVTGTLVHTDASGSSGSTAEVGAGGWGWLTTGAGVRHAEHASADGPARFIQVWLRAGDAPAEAEPAYRTGTGPLTVPTAAGDAVLTPVHLEAGATTTLLAAARVHAFVATGALLRSSLAQPLQTGDAFLLTGEPAYDVTAAVPTDLLVWTLP
ncbi:MAG TPA: pirin family protein [Nocardioides sp.]|nr:pirin family protein [Nocardioides sp.]